jgi:hypothetical protein
MSARRQPVVALTIQAAEANFNRLVTIEGRDDDPKSQRSGTEAGWKPVATGSIRSVQAGRISERRLTIPFPSECRFRFYRITVRNQDNPPLTIRHASFTANVYECLFLPRPDCQYRVYYGGTAEPPQYDVATVLGNLPPGASDPWVLGDRSNNPAYRGAGRRAPGGKTLLVAAVVAMAGVLVLLIAKTAGRVEREHGG